MRYASALAPAAWLALLVQVACHGATAPAPRRALLVVIDALRADRMSCYGYRRMTTPSLDGLARRGVVFEQHYVQGRNTPTSLPTLLFSRYFVKPLMPTHRSVPVLNPADLFQGFDSEAVSLPRALSRNGLLTAMISAHFWLKEGSAFAREFEEVHDLWETLSYDPALGYPQADAVVDYAIDWMQHAGDRGFFLYLHLMDTHFPHRYGEDAQAFLPPAAVDQSTLARFADDGRPRDTRSRPTAAEQSYLDALYDGSVRFTDRHLGRLLEALDSWGWLDDMALVITSDHGEHLLEQPGRFEHGADWYDPVARAPLIIAQPAKVDPGRVDFFSEGIDIAPTVLGLLGIRPAEGKRMDGLDLLQMRAGALPERHYVFKWNAVRSRRYKCLFSASAARLLGPQVPAAGGLSGELYDLETDPGETRNLWSQTPAVVDRLLSVHRAALGPAYRRYAAAVSQAQPAAPFAIGVKDLQIDGRTTEASPELTLEELEETRPGRWVISRSWNHFFLAAHSPTAALPVAFELPNGRYRVGVSASGGCRLRIVGDEPFELARSLSGSAGALTIRELAWPTALPMGDFDVSGERLAIEVEPLEKSACLVRYFALTPLGSEAPQDDPGSQSPERLERLRALGYVQ